MKRSVNEANGIECAARGGSCCGDSSRKRARLAAARASRRESSIDQGLRTGAAGAGDVPADGDAAAKRVRSEAIRSWFASIF
jgi:hypothetical protein